VNVNPFCPIKNLNIEFYQTFIVFLGFDPSPSEPMTLMVTLQDLRAALGFPPEPSKPPLDHKYRPQN
jgi:hypothetical protein